MVWVNGRFFSSLVFLRRAAIDSVNASDEILLTFWGKFGKKRISGESGKWRYVNGRTESTMMK